MLSSLVKEIGDYRPDRGKTWPTSAEIVWRSLKPDTATGARSLA